MASTMMVQPIVTMAENEQNGNETAAETVVNEENEGVVTEGGDTGNTEEVAAEGAAELDQETEFESILPVATPATSAVAESGVHVFDVISKDQNSIGYATVINTPSDVGYIDHGIANYEEAKKATNFTGKKAFINFPNHVKNVENGIKFRIYGNQRNEYREGYPVDEQTGARVDYPLNTDVAAKIIQEAPHWKGKLRATGKKIDGQDFSAGGSEEFLATEIYKEVFEQGEPVLIKDYSKRFELLPESIAAGWKIVAVDPSSNLPGGLAYNPEKDTIEGKIVTNLENGVYDLRTSVVVSNGKETYWYYLADLRCGWIGWKDTKPPTILGKDSSETLDVDGEFDISIQYKDDSGSHTFKKAGNDVTYTTEDGKKLAVREEWRTALTGLAGYNSKDADRVSIDVLPGAEYSATEGVVKGTAKKAGNYRLAVLAKDYDLATCDDKVWNISGQEAHSYITVHVRPKVEVLNIDTYTKTLKVKVSDGATNLKITMPAYDKMPEGENIINLENRPTDGNKSWFIMNGQTPKVKVIIDNNGYLSIPISSDLSSKAGVDNIKAEAWSNDVSMVLLRKKLKLVGPDDAEHIATFDETSGHWMLPTEYAVVENDNPDGSKTITKREVWTNLKAVDVEKGPDGNVINQVQNNYVFSIYEYSRKYKDGEVIDVDAKLKENIIDVYNTDGNEGLFAKVDYDSINDKWTSEDGSKVNLIDDPTKYIVETESGFRGEIEKPKNLINSDEASIANSQPNVSAQDINRLLNDSVNLVTDGKVTITDVEDQNAGKTTTITSIEVLKPKSNNPESIEVKNPVLKLEKPGDYTVTVNVKDSNGNIVNAKVDGTKPGEDMGQDTAVNSCTYHIYVPLVKVVYDTDDKTIDLGSKDITDIPIGDTYHTNNENNRPNQISIGERVFELDEDSLPDNKSGVVTRDQVTVTYKYNEVKTGLTVEFVDENGKKFVDKDGNILRKDDEVLTNQPIGTPYDLTKHSEDHKRIPVGNKIYERVAITPDKLTGTLSLNKDKKPTVIQYVYKEVTPSLTVKYRDLDGNEIKPDKLVLDKQHAGTPYDVSTEEYKPVKFTDGAGKVYELQANETLINGKKSDKLSGNLGGDDIVVTFKYKEVKTSLTVKFVDEKGKEIKGEVPVHKDVSVGTEYNLEGIENEPITTSDGKVYVIESVPDDMKGKLTEDAKIITLVYKEVKSAVVVNYEDEAGNKLVDAKVVVKDQSVGTPYDASTTEFKLPKITLSNGKVYKIVPKKTKGSLTGKVTEKNIDITFVYEEVKTDLVVKYVDESGNEIKLPVTVLKDVSCGTAYNVDTASLKPVKIVIDGKEYELVVEKTIGKMSGKLVDGGNEVRFVYRLVKKLGILPVIKHDEVKPNVPRTGDAVMGNAVIAWFMSVVSGLFGYKKLKDDQE